ncbi:MAG: ABC transporter substrate-binding protein [Brachymonas sp.]
MSFSKTILSAGRRAALVSLFLIGALGAIGTSVAQSRLVIGQTFMAGSIDPAEGSAAWALATHGVAEKLFTVARDGRVIGQLAQDIKRVDELTWDITLQPGRRFSDGQVVTAAEVAAALARTNEKNAAARASVGRMTLQAQDELRLRIRSERPTPVMATVLAEWPFAVYRMADRPVFTGPYAISAFRAGDGIDLVPSSHYTGAAKRQPMTIKRFPDGASMAVALEGREIDMAFNLPVEAVPRIRSRDGLSVQTFLVGYQYMMWYNTRKPALADRRVRKALDLALDRREIAQAVRGGEPAAGAFPSTSPFVLREAARHDANAASKLLDEAGWKRGTDGRRMKDGQPLRLVLVAYPQRPDLVTMQPVIRARLAALGLDIQTRVVDQVSTVTSSGDFDLLLWAQHTLPAGDPAFFLNAFFRTGAGNNSSGIASPEVDKLLDQLGRAESQAQRVTSAEAIQRAIAEEMPVSYLLTPAWNVGLSSRLAGYEAWGSDYNIIRADFAAKP